MQRPIKLLIAGLVIIGLVAAWMMLRPGNETVVRSFVTDLGNAKEPRPGPDAFSAVSATLAGETLEAIHVVGNSRIKWDVTVPDDAWFAFSLGLKEEAWTMKGDGVLFMIGASDGIQYDELLSLVVNPFGNESDRRWLHLTVDLSPYAGKTVELILNTRASPPPAPGTVQQNDANGDLALWGNPRLIVR
jgi:hypothetical protein